MGTKPPAQGPPRPREPEDVWVRDEIKTEARQAVRRGSKAPAPRRESVEEPDTRTGPELAKAVGATRAPKIEARLKDASRAFEREQYTAARRVLRPLAEEAPTVPAVRELLGLTYYRLGQWKPAIRELEAFREITGSTEQHPVLADCYRAIKRWPAVDDLWEELREVSPSAELVTEGRIVAAGSLADRGKLPQALALLEKGRKTVKRPQEHHLRLAYAVADLRERSGDVPGAREQFEWVARQDPEFADAADRAASLR